MRERNQIILIVIITAVMAVAVTQIRVFPHAKDQGAYVKDYDARFYANGTLVETFTYTITSSGKTFLYRYWDAPLSISAYGSSKILFQDVQVPDGTYWYIRDMYGKITSDPMLDPIYDYNLRQKTYSNEVGAFNPDGYMKGDYTVKYVFTVKAPLEYDDEYVHLNLMLAREHLPYRNLQVSIEDLGFIEAVFPHPPALRKTVDKKMIIYTGSSGLNELLEFEFLMTPEALNSLPGSEKFVKDVRNWTINVNRLYSAVFYYTSLVFLVSKLTIFLIPLGLYLYWSRVGREKE
ncbi:DUF2207 domain-containing protein, partial [Candidatus Bathyarchaeota archaeon]|nr:DUF2207 domain-containing protein [Candidatus Bathyarchaeota archaeon]